MFKNPKFNIRPELGAKGRESGTVREGDILSEDTDHNPSDPDSISAQIFVQNKLVDRRKDRIEEESLKVQEAIHDFMGPTEIKSILDESKKTLLQKRKQDVYSFKRQGDGDEELILQSPEAGKRHKVTTDRGATFMVATPVVRGGQQKLLEGGKQHRDDFHVQFICKTPPFSKSTVAVPNYVKHLVCPDYIVCSKEQLLGKIGSWQQASMDIFDIIEKEGIYKTWAYEQQREWARHVTKIMTGISGYSDMAIECLNRETLILVLEGVEDKEHADFVFQMAKCNKFEIYLFPHFHTLANFEVTTRFDDNDIFQHSFGKTYIEDLSD